MLRRAVTPRQNWQGIAEQYGFYFHHVDGQIYWDESACYEFSLAEIEEGLEAPAQELHGMCLDLVDEASRNEEILSALRIPPPFWDAVAESWRRRDFSLYGRFDFSFDGACPAKLLEYNADTPTSVYEGAFFQWRWLEDCVALGLLQPEADQFNFIQEKLCEAFGEFAKGYGLPLHFASCKGSEEDRATVEYLLDCAVQAGLPAKFIYMEDIGLDEAGGFYDLENYPIKALFKLYPWEFIWEDAFAAAAISGDALLIEPPWKMILSNKGLLPLLWERYPGHPNLLPAYFTPDELAGKSYVRKPLLSREGANIAIRQAGKREGIATPGEYGREGHIYQEYWPLPGFDGNYPVCGVWIANGQACGLGMREDTGPVTRDTSRFVPHVII